VSARFARSSDLVFLGARAVAEPVARGGGGRVGYGCSGPWQQSSRNLRSAAAVGSTKLVRRRGRAPRSGLPHCPRWRTSAAEDLELERPRTARCVTFLLILGFEAGEEASTNGTTAKLRLIFALCGSTRGNDARCAGGSGTLAPQAEAWTSGDLTR